MAIATRHIEWSLDGGPFQEWRDFAGRDRDVEFPVGNLFGRIVFRQSVYDIEGNTTGEFTHTEPIVIFPNEAATIALPSGCPPDAELGQRLTLSDNSIWDLLGDPFVAGDLGNPAVLRPTVASRSLADSDRQFFIASDNNAKMPSSYVASDAWVRRLDLNGDTGAVGLLLAPSATDPGTGSGPQLADGALAKLWAGFKATGYPRGVLYQSTTVSQRLSTRTTVRVPRPGTFVVARDLTFRRGSGASQQALGFSFWEWIGRSADDYPALPTSLFTGVAPWLGSIRIPLDGRLWFLNVGPGSGTTTRIIPAKFGKVAVVFRKDFRQTYGTVIGGANRDPFDWEVSTSRTTIFNTREVSIDVDVCFVDRDIYTGVLNATVFTPSTGTTMTPSGFSVVPEATPNIPFNPGAVVGSKAVYIRKLVIRRGTGDADVTVEFELTEDSDGTASTTKPELESPRDLRLLFRSGSEVIVWTLGDITNPIEDTQTSAQNRAKLDGWLLDSDATVQFAVVDSTVAVAPMDVSAFDAEAMRLAVPLNALSDTTEPFTGVPSTAWIRTATPAGHDWERGDHEQVRDFVNRMTQALPEIVLVDNTRRWETLPLCWYLLLSAPTTTVQVGATSTTVDTIYTFAITKPPIPAAGGFDSRTYLPPNVPNASRTRPSTVPEGSIVYQSNRLVTYNVFGTAREFARATPFSDWSIAPVAPEFAVTVNHASSATAEELVPVTVIVLPAGTAPAMIAVTVSAGDTSATRLTLPPGATQASFSYIAPLSVVGVDAVIEVTVTRSGLTEIVRSMISVAAGTFPPVPDPVPFAYDSNTMRWIGEDYWQNRIHDRIVVLDTTRSNADSWTARFTDDVTVIDNDFAEEDSWTPRFTDSVSYTSS